MSHVTRTPLSRSKGQRSRSPGRFAHRCVGATGGCSGWRENVLAVGNCYYVAVCSAAQGTSAPTGRTWPGAYRGGRPPIACYCCWHWHHSCCGHVDYWCLLYPCVLLSLSSLTSHCFVLCTDTAAKHQEGYVHRRSLDPGRSLANPNLVWPIVKSVPYLLEHRRGALLPF